MEVKWNSELRKKFYQLTVPISKIEFDKYIERAISLGFGKDIEWSIEPLPCKGKQIQRYVLWRDNNWERIDPISKQRSERVSNKNRIKTEEVMK